MSLDSHVRFTHWRRIIPLLLLIVLALPIIGKPQPVHAAATDLFFSEYIEGSSFNKAVEIYNGTGAAVDMGALGYAIDLYSNGSATVGVTINLTATLADGDVWVVGDDSADAPLLALIDQTTTASLW